MNIRDTQMYWRKKDAREAMKGIRQLVKKLGKVPDRWITEHAVELLQTAEKDLREAVEFLDADRKANDEGYEK